MSFEEDITMAKQEIFDADLENIVGGQITYTWNGHIGSIGINGYNNFVLLNKDAFGAFYMEHKGEMTEKEILKRLFGLGIIRKPTPEDIID